MMKTMLIDKKKAQAPAPVKAVEHSCVTCGGAHSYRNCPAIDGNVYRDNIQEYVSQAAAAKFNQGNTNSRPSTVSYQIRPPGFPPIQKNQNRFNQNQGSNFNQNQGTNFNQNHGSNFNQGQVYQTPTIQTLVYQAPSPTQQMQGVSKTDFENYVKANDAVLRNMKNQGQGLQNQMTNLTEMLSKFISSNTASSSSLGTLPSQTVTNPHEHVNAISTRSGKTCEGPSTPFVPTPIVSTPLKEPEQNPKTSMDKVQKPSSENLGLSQLKTKIWFPSQLLLPRSGIAKDVNVKVGVFQFPADFVVVDFEPDPRVPLILGRCFLKTGRALIDVYEGDYSVNYNDMTANRIDVVELACEEYSQEVLGFSDVIASGNPTPGYDPIVFNFTSSGLS
ncbi:reverse transcriptase domain-containing protein [Tanacetum coccineum]